MIPQLIVLFVFVMFITDWSRKPNCLLVKKGVVTALQFSIFMQLLIFSFVSISISSFSFLDLIMITVAILGLFFIIKARCDLGANYTHAGYVLAQNDYEIIHRGFYRYVQHPIYLGAILFLFSYFLMVVTHSTLLLIIPTFSCFIITVSAVVLIARAETRRLRL
jgi:protein-S-isoprenylcysteine O-methyltransferase Ste14